MAPDLHRRDGDDEYPQLAGPLLVVGAVVILLLAIADATWLLL